MEIPFTEYITGLTAAPWPAVEIAITRTDIARVLRYSGVAWQVNGSPLAVSVLRPKLASAASPSKAKLLHFLDNSFAIARFKAQAATDPVKACSGRTNSFRAITSRATT
jgi:hypothetical protein